jgi:hypothetical protein
MHRVAATIALVDLQSLDQEPPIMVGQWRSIGDPVMTIPNILGGVSPYNHQPNGGIEHFGIGVELKIGAPWSAPTPTLSEFN